MDKNDSNTGAMKDKRTIPVLEEQLKVDRRKVEIGRTRVNIKVRNIEETIEEPLVKEGVEIKHVAIDRFIEQPVETRTEGELTIIPVMEEVLIVEKKVLLKEELHVRRITERVTHLQKEVVRKEEAVVEHFDGRDH